MKKTAILTAIALAATLFYASGKIDYGSMARRWHDVPLEKLKNEARDCITRGRMDSALVLYTMMINRYSPDMPDKDKRLCASAMNNAGYIYMFHLNNYSEAYANLLKALHIAEDTGFGDLLPCIYLNIGNVYTTYYDSDNALEMYKKAFHTSIPAKDWDILLTTTTNLVGISIQYGDAGSIAEEVAEFGRLRIPRMPMLAFSRSMCAAAGSIMAGRYGDAMAHLRKAAGEVDTDLKPERYRLAAQQLAAIVLGMQNKYGEALETVLDVERRAAKEAPDLQVEARRLAADIYAKTGNADSALAWQERWAQLKDSIFRNQQYNRIRDLNLAYEMKNADDKLQRSENRRRTATVAMAITAVALAVILPLAVLVTLKNRRLNRRNHDLYRRNGEIMRMNENERKMRTAYGQRLDECRREIERLSAKAAPQATRKTQASAMGGEEKQTLLEKISRVMDDDGEISRNEFSVERLSKLVGSNSHYVSAVINETYGKNFNSVLGEARVRLACKRLGDNAAYGNLTIEAIAGELGFKSRSNFVTVFKRVTGLTPSEYKKISRESGGGADED